MSRKQRNNCIRIMAWLLLALMLCACGSTKSAQAAPAAENPQPTASPAAAAAPEPTALPEPQQAAIVLRPQSETTEAPVAAEFSPDLSEQPPVDDSFFADAAFVGNSLVCGLKQHGGLTAGDFYAATSTSVVNIELNYERTLKNGRKGTLLQALYEKQYGKVYLLLGINEIGFEPDYFAELYGALLDDIAEHEPDADIYIMGLTPVTEKKSAGNDLFNAERIALYNEKLYGLAETHHCRYVDLFSALADEAGYLPEEESTDGIHMKPAEYPRWADYLRTHYVSEAE